MNAAPGQRDPQAEQDHAKWIGWMEASTYSTHPDDCEGMAEAFAAGMQAQRDLTAPGPQPAPVSPDLECAVCQHVSSPHGVPASGATPGRAAYKAKIAASLARTGSADVDADSLWDTYPESHHADWEAAAWAGHDAIAAQDARPAPVVTPKALAAALALRPIKVRAGNGWETRRPLYPDALAAELLDAIKARSADAEPQPAPELAAAPDSEAAEMRAVIDMIWRMCQRTGPSAGVSQEAVINGEHLAARIAGLIKNSGMEPF